MYNMSKCIEYNGIKDRDGYGRYKGQGAHRIAYEKHYGPIPKNMVVMHTCDNPSCINPKHLKLGTHKQNMEDMVVKDRSTRGTRNHTAKLTDNDVRYIRASSLSNYKIAEEFDVHHTTIAAIRRRQTWKHI